MHETNIASLPGTEQRALATRKWRPTVVRNAGCPDEECPGVTETRALECGYGVLCPMFAVPTKGSKGEKL